MLTLNNDQQLVKQAIQAMRARDRLVVSGRAGSGKTYAIAHSVAERKALFLAPTHPARTVLEQELRDKRHRVATIHSAIGWYRYRNENLETVEGYLPAREARTRVESAKEGKPDAFSEVDIIIVDEFSMVGSFLFRAVEEYAAEFDLPVVYSGDRFQLPPVKDHEVIMDQDFETITLDTSVRFPRQSGIFLTGEMLRDWIEERPEDELQCLHGGADVQVIPGEEWIASLKNRYEKGDSLLAVTSDNTTLQRLRRAVRHVNHDGLDEGDLVISKQTDNLFHNGERFTVDQIERNMRVLKDVPSCVDRFRALTLDGVTITFHETDRIAFVPDSEKIVDKLSLRIRRLHQKGKLDRKQAVRILDWIEDVNRFELSALATVHKSQGRSVDTVYIDTNTVLKRPMWLSPKDHKRLLYTAITRARERVVLYEMSGFCTRGRPASVAAIPSRVPLNQAEEQKKTA
ncbi:AAA family ATPase [Leisingera sp. MMG026]|uniref:ATP-dependent DNA helicase n=1 Tax=Leisingera sp. MMG026 TaxID=2909982 RepID=UPI001F226457|nr:AAA family ATPase [Leisingera sp. MMG026]MCF6433773.1 AAA family ATPase [Leisingera sp. MMG026]